jgi:CRISPR type III-B/RAMP module-associated protein Cmr3
MGKWYYCTLKPLGEFFFGGEHIFDLAGEEKSYFIKSEILPNQSTLLGTLRFLVLSKAGLLNDVSYIPDPRKIHDQIRLIGTKGFIIDGMMNVKADYGEILSISPVFLSDSIGHHWIKTPYNHRKYEKNYSYFDMEQGIHTDINRETLLPKQYEGKNGLTESFMDIDDEFHPIYDCFDGDDKNTKDLLFTFSDHTRISRRVEREGFFKKQYVRLKDCFGISFYCETKSEGCLPEEEIVYMGQEKSAFHFRCEEWYETNSPIAIMEKKIACVGCGNEADVYYAASDIYLPKGIARDDLLFSIVVTKPFRTLTYNMAAKNDFCRSRTRSEEYQLIKAGSVFYFQKGANKGLVFDADLEGMKQVGFNYLFLMGGKQYE